MDAEGSCARAGASPEGTREGPREGLSCFQWSLPEAQLGPSATGGAALQKLCLRKGKDCKGEAVAGERVVVVVLLGWKAQLKPSSPRSRGCLVVLFLHVYKGAVG